MVATVSQTAASSSAKPNAANAALSQNYETFLKLLTSQLSNQDPLNPVDSSQFTQQLVQYSQVEQQIKTNDKLESLLSEGRIAGASAGLAFIGHVATVASPTAALGQDGGASWTYDANGAVGDVKLSVLDAKGHVVFSKTEPAGDGKVKFTWDGRNTLGARQAPGAYTLKIGAADVNGDDVAAKISTMLKITGIAPNDGDGSYLTAAGSLPFSAIQSIAD